MEGAAEPANVVAEGELLMAALPVFGPLFSDDDGVSGRKGAPRELAAATQARQQHRDQRAWFCRLSITRQQRDDAGRQVTVPDPFGRVRGVAAPGRRSSAAS